MARQKGIIKLKGTIGDVSFYKSKDGYLAREKGGVDKERIRNDPAFQRTRENGSEFGRAGRAGKLIRDSFRLLLQNASDSRVTSRLTREILRAIKADATNIRGERTITAGDVNLLSGFDFNNNSILGSTLFVPLRTTLDRAGGAHQLSLPAFVPSSSIAYPPGATHCKLVLGGAELDFGNGSFVFDRAESAEIVLGPQQESSFDLTLAMTASSTDDVMLVFGIEFLQEVNGVRYPLRNGAFNPLAVVVVDRVAATTGP